jgi:predicted Zn-ribbon and HTH transcriptional regulator
MAAERTRREEIVALLEESRRDFEDLRRQLRIPVHVLREDLRHIRRSVRGAGGRLHASAPECAACGFSFREGGLTPPGRCPRCHGGRVHGPELWITRGSAPPAKRHHPVNRDDAE